jgi:hypothetical protein
VYENVRDEVGDEIKSYRQLSIESSSSPLIRKCALQLQYSVVRPPTAEDPDMGADWRK